MNASPEFRWNAFGGATLWQRNDVSGAVTYLIRAREVVTCRRAESRVCAVVCGAEHSANRVSGTEPALSQQIVLSGAFITAGIASAI